MLQLKANLLRKENAYEPRTCMVEKVIPMYGRSFEQFIQDLLEYNLCIHDNSDAWRELVKRHAADIAEQTKIPLKNLRWYAAFHDTTHHPHGGCVMMA